MMYDLVGEKLEKEAENKRTDILSRLETPVNDARKLKVLLFKVKKYYVDKEIQRFGFNWIRIGPNSYKLGEAVKHEKVKKGHYIRVILSGWLGSIKGRAKVTLIKDNQIYSQSSTSKKKKAIFKDVEPNSQYQVYITYDGKILKKTVTVGNNNISLNINIDDEPELSIKWYIYQYEKKYFADKTKNYLHIAEYIKNNPTGKVVNFSKKLTNEYYNELIDRPFYYINYCDRITFPEQSNGVGKDAFKEKNKFEYTFKNESHNFLCSTYLTRVYYFGNGDNFATELNEKYNALYIDSLLRYGNGKHVGSYWNPNFDLFESPKNHNCEEPHI